MGREPERLQKILARCGVGSRRQVEEWIRHGRVTVNGQIAELGQKADLAEDAVKIDGRRIHAPKRPQYYFLLNKPVGFVSTKSDPEGRPTVMELLPERVRKSVVPVGRLDFESEGLILLTDDGDLAQRISHPSFGCTKTYAVKVKGHPDAAKIARLEQGIRLDNRLTAPVKIKSRPAPPGKRTVQDNSWWTVVLNEGRTRQIREMFFRIGHPVARLRRVAIGPIGDRSLMRGKWRSLTHEEVEKLRRRTERKVARKTPPSAGSARPKAPSGARKAPAPAKSRTSTSRAKAGPSKGKPKARRPAQPSRGPSRGKKRS